MYMSRFDFGHPILSEQEDQIDSAVIDRICRKAIKRLKSDISPDTLGDNEYGSGFNSYDALALCHCCFGYDFDEINPYLEKYLYDIIDEYSTGTPIGNLDIVFDRFLEMLDEHSATRKVMKVYERY